MSSVIRPTALLAGRRDAPVKVTGLSWTAVGRASAAGLWDAVPSSPPGSLPHLQQGLGPLLHPGSCLPGRETCRTRCCTCGCYEMPEEMLNSPGWRAGRGPMPCMPARGSLCPLWPWPGTVPGTRGRCSRGGHAHVRCVRALGLAAETGFCYLISLALNRAHRNPPFRVWRAGCVPQVVARAPSYRVLHLIITRISIL